MSISFLGLNYACAENNLYAAHERLKNFFREQTLYKLMSVVVTNLLKHQPEWYQKEIWGCLKNANSVKSYARCVAILIKHSRVSVNGHINKYTETTSAVTPEPNSFYTSNVRQKRVVNEERFTLPPAEEQESSTATTMPPDKSGLQNFGESMLSLIQQIKAKHGSWFNLPKSVQNNNDSRKHLHIQPDFSKNVFTNHPKINEVYRAIKGLLTSPMVMLRDNFEPVEMGHEFNLLSEDFNVDVLSPRFLSMVGKSNHQSILSPDILNLDEGDRNNLLSLRNLFSKLEENERKPLMQFFSELTGAADIIRYMGSFEFAKILRLSKVDAGDGVSLPINSTFDVLNNTLEGVFKLMSTDQLLGLNANGYTFMNASQIYEVYGVQKSKLNSFINQFSKLSEAEKDERLMQEILDIAYPRRRFKRQNSPPIILAPYVGGTVLTTYVLAPSILSPSVFSYVILGPLVLSPYILSPYVFGPFILSPEILTPFILSPFVLSPTVLSPIVLGPSILNPIVLSPFVLSPFVLSPSVLSPTALTPNILSPGVLGPGILSPVVLGPSVLSPSVLNPSILSPTVLSPAILSPGALNPSVLSPGLYSPSVLSPCFMCKKRIKKYAIKIYTLRNKT